MLKDLTKREWLQMLKLNEHEVPRVIILCGTRNLKAAIDRWKSHIHDLRELSLPNGIIEDVWLGNLQGIGVGVAAVYGAPMASEVTHLFGVLGTQRVIQTGVCGGLAYSAKAGDIVVALSAGMGDGASQYYVQSKTDIACSQGIAQRVRDRFPICDLQCISGPVFSTAALFAENETLLLDWKSKGYVAADMETAATYAVAQYFSMDRVSILSVFDNPLKGAHIMMSDDQSAARWDMSATVRMGAVLSCCQESVREENGDGL